MNVLIISRSKEISILFNSKFRELDLETCSITLSCLMEAKICCESQSFDFIIYDTNTYPVPPTSDLEELRTCISCPMIVYSDEFKVDHMKYIRSSLTFCYITRHCVYVGFSHILKLIRMSINFIPPEICEVINTPKYPLTNGFNTGV